MENEHSSLSPSEQAILEGDVSLAIMLLPEEFKKLFRNDFCLPLETIPVIPPEDFVPLYDDC